MSKSIPILSDRGNQRCHFLSTLLLLNSCIFSNAVLFTWSTAAKGIIILTTPSIIKRAFSETPSLKQGEVKRTYKQILYSAELSHTSPLPPCLSFLNRICFLTIFYIQQGSMHVRVACISGQHTCQGSMHVSSRFKQDATVIRSTPIHQLPNYSALVISAKTGCLEITISSLEPCLCSLHKDVDSFFLKIVTLCRLSHHRRCCMSRTAML